MSSSLARMEDWRRGLNTQRFHTFPTVGPPQTVGHHSCGVALIVMLCHPNPSTWLLQRCLVHDLSEGKLGDLPATTKWMSPELDHLWQQLEREEEVRLELPFHALDERDQASFALADGLEGLLYSREQVMMGNNTYHLIGIRWCRSLLVKGCWDLAPVGFRQLFTELHHWFLPMETLEFVEAPSVPGLS